MKTLLIVYPHWPPSNLAGVHRPRLISNYLPEFNWHPIVLTVDPKYYEEEPDWDLLKTVSFATEVIHVDAFPVARPRIIGDIGLRAFWQIYQAAKNLIKERKIDFIWIPIPSFYTALVGRLLYQKFEIPYGIDYIDPWVRDISGRRDWRHVMSNWLAKFLEPIAIKKAALITGVSEEYYKPALLRNFKKEDIYPPLDKPSLESSVNDSFGDSTIKPVSPAGGRFNKSTNQQITKSQNHQIHHLAFPYGFDPNDHEIRFNELIYPWSEIKDCRPIVYAGAFLPNSRLFVQVLFKVVQQLIRENSWDERFHLFFLGTGNYSGKTISEYARNEGVGEYVHEHRDRLPFLHILNFLSKAFAVLIVGSTEKHYTASKVFQGMLSRRPVLSILHSESSAYAILKKIKADQFAVGWNENLPEKEFGECIKMELSELFRSNGDWEPDIDKLEKEYSSRILAKRFADKLDEIIANS